MKRSAGILMPISSLDSGFGIGCFSKEANRFIDFLKESGQSYWQILPIGPTGFGDSPYQSSSAFAGNPYYIDPVTLKEDGLLSEQELWSYDFGNDPEKVDYGKLYHNRYLLLKTAYDHFVEKGGLTNDDYCAFKTKEADWLDDYSLFMSIKREQDGKSWLDWPKELRERKEAAIMQARVRLEELMEFYCFMQYEFKRQYRKLREYAHKQGIEIIGDMPFFVSIDSADLWSHPEVFRTGKDGKPKEVAGTPPDAFSPKGQIWGFPLYNWDALKKTKYRWWMRRIEHACDFYDVIRIDHFHGFVSAFAIPYEDKDAVRGFAEKGPGEAFFTEMKKQLGDVRLFAEDLGNVTEENVKLLNDTGIPGMKILQYAFTSWDSIYMPHKLTKNAVIYTGNHDNMTTRSWAESLKEGEIKFARSYIRSVNTDYNAFTWDMIREAYHSPCDLCIIPLQDFLCLKEEGRMNTPGTAQGNWVWRLKPNFLSRELALAIHEMASTYSRIPPKEVKAED
ncbi:MAG: 4-alpha-glucanotransferase [Solobacterium sp.]|nr:4-alpha-glucanotransferase [Solobacterium sp.]